MRRRVARTPTIPGFSPPGGLALRSGGDSSGFASSLAEASRAPLQFVLHGRRLATRKTPLSHGRQALRRPLPDGGGTTFFYFVAFAPAADQVERSNTSKRELTHGYRLHIDT